MKKILFIDAAVRQNSRTRELAQYLISKLSGEVRYLPLYETDIPLMNAKILEWREACCAAKSFDDEYFALAKEFAAADTVVVAAPFWDLSFPAIFKQYIEAISVNGITFTYSESGTPVGLCSAKDMYYVATAGGYVSEDDDTLYDYLLNLFSGLYGIEHFMFFVADGLDIYGADIKKIFDEMRQNIDSMIKDVELITSIQEKGAQGE